jgi:ADP-ribosylation factor-binding protein GGA
VQDKILELVQQWNYVVYETSKYRRDMQHINDMYRLLSQKGYSFPTMRAETANVMRANDVALKTRDELEAEDRLAQSAKLQELLRRGTPADLQQANDLMKIMAGYPVDGLQTVDYSKREQEELDRIEERTNRLRETLMQQKADGKSVSDNDQVQELLSAVKTAQPKITKWIEENVGDDDERSRLDRLLYLNDLMNDVIVMYEAKKAGKPVPPLTAVKPPASADSGGKSPPKAAQQQQQPTTLIDFDFLSSSSGVASLPTAQLPTKSQSMPQTTQTSPAVVVAAVKQPAAQKQQDLLGDLMGLQFNPYPSGFGQGGAIQLSGPPPGFSATQVMTPFVSPPMNQPITLQPQQQQQFKQQPYNMQPLQQQFMQQQPIMNPYTSPYASPPPQQQQQPPQQQQQQQQRKSPQQQQQPNYYSGSK